MAITGHYDGELNQIALESDFSSLTHWEELFHHLLYNICILPSSCRFNTAIDIRSFNGESGKEKKYLNVNVP